MGGPVPKQFLLLGGRPVLMRTIEAFHAFDGECRITVVLPAEHLDRWGVLCGEYGFEVPHRVAAGGGTRFESVREGLRGLEGDGLVAVHDGVRPLIRPETIQRIFNEAEIYGCAIPALPPTESVRWAEGDQSRVIDRTHLQLIQTPQVFLLNKLKDAYVQSYDPSFTDDATVWEEAGFPVHLCEGQVYNIKITTKEDLELAEMIQGERRKAKGER